MKLGTRLIIFSSFFLVLLPAFGFYFVNKIEQAIIQGQEEAQSMTASAIALVLQGYSDLFNIDKNAIYVYPAAYPVNIDAYKDDWYTLKSRFTQYANGAFSLLLLERKPYLYAYLQVKDKNIVYRDPRNKPLDSSDHIRLEYLDADDHHHRMIMASEGQGTVSVYEVREDWSTWTTGKNISSVYGILRETDKGYDVEFRLPLKWFLDSRRLAISIVNVFSENERYPDTIAGTNSHGRLNPLLFQSQKINEVLGNLGGSDSRICVIDRYRRIRAVVGGDELRTSFCQNVEKIDNSMVDGILDGRLQQQVSRIQLTSEPLIVAAHPVRVNDEITGAVLVGRNSDQILAMQRDTLVNIILAAISIFILAVIILLTFSYWLAFRINRLNRQVKCLIDETGRPVDNQTLSEEYSQDEIGDLSRSFADLLEKLNRYTRFLESVPRMLRHEILNPVNTISLSLQTMTADNQPDAISTAGNAIKQLEIIVCGLTEAANIDDALKQTESEIIDIAELLNEYIKTVQKQHPEVHFRYAGCKSGLPVDACDYRIVQLLDKIKDNAVDFASSGSEIVFQLDLHQSEEVWIHIINEGEFLPQAIQKSLLMGMASYRKESNDTPHPGIGLYVASRIARFHHGDLQIANRRDKPGVEVILKLPLHADKADMY